AKAEAAEAAKQAKAEAAAKAKAEAAEAAKQAKAEAEAAEKAKAEAAAAEAKKAAELAAAEKAKAAAAAKAEAAKANLAARAAEKARIISEIRQKVSRSWIQPPDKKGLKCLIKVRLMSNGTVIDATVVRSSGDDIFDQSAENAVHRASPLPVPQDKELFAKEFRAFNLCLAENDRLCQ
ncbi:MAG: cell envelope integrity protein TolA, partial [Methylococcaceae bacterium]|nr:cell envelope integrity protein TolA [Methylococcaceae bacterium]